MEGWKDDAEVSDRLEKSLVLEDQMETYGRLISEGKAVAKQGDIQEALQLFRQAFSIHPTPKLESRIKKIEELLAQNDSEDEDDEFVNVNNSGLMLYKDLHDRLYDYQRDGVSFLFSLHRDGRRGGVLADDMGLGKTIQIISFLSGMYDNDLIKHTLLVMPTSLITNWVKEFSKWTPGMRVKDFHGASKAERTRNLEKVQRRGGVVITTYTMLMNNWQQLASFRGKEFCWDYMILDEAHKIKNSSTKTAKSAYAVPSKNRILLTGTPVQNNLREMWTLFDFACQGALLGTAKTFKSEYENPITRAREKDATPGEKALGSRMSENLMTLIKPYFLRRTKSEVQKKKTGGKEANSEADDHQNPQPAYGAVMPKLTRKNDLIVWTYLSPVQEDIYRQFISLDHIKELLMTTKSPLAELNILKKLCDHPRLLSANAITQLGLDQNPEGENDGTDVKSIANVSDETLISESGKLVFLLALLERLREEGHRTLVFAHYRTVLDILQRILGNRGFKLLRLDGSITQITEREKLICRFQKDKRYSVFLLTTQVGGVGITLTAADRVVIYDPSWNPATDAQAVDRAYRIGQTENVVIYRLITCGTVEEKIYRRQVFKDSLIRQNTGDTKNPFRYFSRQELKELFTLEDPTSSSTQLQLQDLHSRQRRTDPALDQHIAQLHAMHMFGISDHDLMFSLDVNHDEDPEDQEACHYIEGRVQKAQELMKAESELQRQLAASLASSTEPAWLRQTPDNTRRRFNERKPRTPGLPPPLPDPNASLEGEDTDRSGSGGQQRRQESSSEVIDLSGEASPEPTGVSSGPDASLIEIPADEKPDWPSRTSETDQQNHSDSDLQQDDAGLESSHGNFNLELEDSDEDEVLDAADTEEEEQNLLTGLQLNGSFSVHKSLTESLVRRAGASGLYRTGASGLDQTGASGLDQTGASGLDQTGASGLYRTADESVLGPRRKRAAVIYDSDEEEQQLIGSFQALGSSTPKMSPPRSRRSVAGNPSNRSRLQLVIQDSEESEEEQEEEEEEKEEEEVEEEEMEVLGMNSEQEVAAGETLHTEDEEDEEASEQLSAAGGDSLAGSGPDEPRPEEEQEEEKEEKEEEEVEEEEMEVLGMNSEQEVAAGETLHTEDEEDEEASEQLSAAGGDSLAGSGLDEPRPEEEEEAGCHGNGASPEGLSPEESSGEAEPMDCRAAFGADPDSYESLVRSGKERISQNRPDDALDFFLRAIDLRPGDPEVQLITIQLYRQLSHRPQHSPTQE